MEPSQPPAPTESRDPAIDVLAERLGVAIARPDIALAALTHKSFVNEHRGEVLQDNERLEFLGDAVIDLAVSHRLMERFPEAREGELSKIRAAMVDEAGLALMARACDLGSLLRLGRGEELTGGRQKSSLLADAMEAVVAALYLGGGLEPVLQVLDRFLGEAFARAAAGTLDRDYKTQFQELAQSRLRSTPRYRVVAEHGPDHSKVFDVELELRGEVIGRGAGRSKKDAEQAAAKLALEAMNGRAEVRPGDSAAASQAVEVAPPGTPASAEVEGAPAAAEAGSSTPAAEEGAPERAPAPGEAAPATAAAEPSTTPAAETRRAAPRRKAKPAPARTRARAAATTRARPGRAKAPRPRARKKK